MAKEYMRFDNYYESQISELNKALEDALSNYEELLDDYESLTDDYECLAHDFASACRERGEYEREARAYRRMFMHLGFLDLVADQVCRTEQ